MRAVGKAGRQAWALPHVLQVTMPAHEITHMRIIKPAPGTDLAVSLVLTTDPQGSIAPVQFLGHWDQLPSALPATQGQALWLCGVPAGEAASSREHCSQVLTPRSPCQQCKPVWAGQPGRTTKTLEKDTI